MAKNTISSLLGKGRKKKGRWFLCTEAGGHFSFVLPINLNGELLPGVSSAWGRGAHKGHRCRCYWNDDPITSLPKGCSVFPSIAGLLTLTCSLTIANTRQSIEQAGWEQCKEGRNSWRVPSGHPRARSLFGSWEFDHESLHIKKMKSSERRSEWQWRWNTMDMSGSFPQILEAKWSFLKSQKPSPKQDLQPWAFWTIKSLILANPTPFHISKRSVVASLWAEGWGRWKCLVAITCPWDNCMFWTTSNKKAASTLLALGAIRLSRILWSQTARLGRKWLCRGY